MGDGVYYYGHEPEVVKVVDQTPFPAADKGDLLPNFLSAIEGHDQLEIGFEEIASVMETSLAIDKMALAELL